jgi:virginiamycin B lyase
MILALTLAILGTACAAEPPGVAAALADTLEIQEWKVPWENTRPRDPTVAADGRVWFVGQVGNYVAVFDPRTAEFRRYDLPARALPHTVTAGPDGMLYYAGNGDAHIGRLDPATGQIRRYDMPDAAARDPHTIVFSETGDAWFTVQGGNFIGRLNPTTGEVRLVQPTVAGARPYGIVVDETNRPWAVLFGTNRVATVDPATMELKEFVLPAAEARPRRLVRTADGMIWYGDVRRGMLGRLDPRDGSVKEWALPGGEDSGPYAMALDDQGKIWIAETGVRPNRLVGFDPAAERFFGSTAIPSGGGAIRHMVFHAPTRSIWFGADTNTLGRAKLP